MLSIINTLSFNERDIINTKENYCFCCDKCNEIPQFTFQHNSPLDETIEISCICSSLTQKINLKDYLVKFNQRFLNRKNCQKVEKHIYTKSVEFCTHCSCWLCESCINEDKDGVRYSNEIKVPFCRNHRQMFKYYCFQCKTNMCEECKSHNGHNIKPLAVLITEEKIKEIENCLGESNIILQNYDVVLEKAQNVLKEKMKKIENEIKK